MSTPKQLRHLFRRFLSFSRRARSKPPAARTCLQFEALEGRLTPAGISGLFNTGVDGSGNPLSSGTDTHYTVVSNGQGNSSFDGSAVFEGMGNLSGTANIEPPGPAPGDSVTTFDYRTTFTRGTTRARSRSASIPTRTIRSITFSSTG